MTNDCEIKTSSFHVYRPTFQTLELFKNCNLCLGQMLMQCVCEHVNNRFMQNSPFFSLFVYHSCTFYESQVENLLCAAEGRYTVELQWLEHLWDQENMFETGVVQANEC